jgi:YidC/Oxa1 family membrane protein insertase
MDKKVFLAAAVSVAILITWQMLFMPDPPPRAPAPDPAAVEQIDLRAPSDEPVEQTRTYDAEPAEEETEPADRVQAAALTEVVVGNGIFDLTLSNRGGVATSWSLSDQSTSFEPLELLRRTEPGQARTLGLDFDDASLTQLLDEALFEVERTKLYPEGGLPGGERIRFTFADGRGLEARKTLTFREESYVVDVDVEVRDRGRNLPARLVLGPGFGELGMDAEKGGGTYYYEAVVWNRSGQVTHRKKSKIENEPGGLSGAIPWAGLEDQYFAALVLPNEPESVVRWRTVKLTPKPEASGESREPVPYALVSVSVPQKGAKLYVGPKKYRLLESLGGELEKSVWFSSSAALAWISRGIFFGLLWIHDNTIPNWGLAIVACTFLLRLLLFPVNQYSMVSMKKTQIQMQRLQPKIKAIKNKYKSKKDAESRTKMNQDMMALYKAEGVNPMGGLSGCLPLLAQFPILIAFYFMLTVAVELRGAPFFGWIKDLSVADPLWITPLLMGVTMFVQQKMAMSKVKDPMQQQQQKFMMIMPFVFTWICLQMPAGMVLYWFVNNVLGIGQQYLVNRHTTRLEAAAQKA